MDPISASCFSLNAVEEARAIIEEKKQEEKFHEIIASCGSLSKYETRGAKTLIPQLIATLYAASFHIVVGVALAYSGILLPQLERDKELQVSTSDGSWIASVITLSVPVGSIAGGFLMDRYGRLNTVKLAALPGLAGWITIAAANGVPMLIVGRLLSGLATALGTGPAVVYITEIARADIRGSLVSFGPTFASLGMVIAFLMGWFVNWRIVAWVSNVFVVVPFILVFLIPESPAWLVSKGKVEEASKSLEWLNKYQPHPFNKPHSLSEMQLQQLQREHQKKMHEESMHASSGLWYKMLMFLKPTGYKPMAILFGLFIFQQFSGIYITLFYSVSFFEAVGSTISPYLASVLIGTMRLIMSCINTYMLRTFNRRALIMTSSIGMTVCMVISGLFTLWISEGTSEARWVPVVCILLYVLTSMVGLLPIPWTMTAEVFPLEIRGVAQSLTYSLANVIMFFAVQSYHILNDMFAGAAGVQFFFAAVSTLALVYTLIFVPETHNKKLRDIEQYFQENTVYLGQRISRNNRATNHSDANAKVNGNNKDIVKALNGQNERLIIEEEA